MSPELTHEMRCECAWCGSQLESKKCIAAQADAVSHGICVSCFEKVTGFPLTAEMMEAVR